MVSAKQAVAVLMATSIAIMPACVITKGKKYHDPDEGYISWAKEIQYWPDESHARYSVYYPTVNMDGMSPGESNEFRLVIHNLASESMDFDIYVDNSDIDGMYCPISDDWITVTEDAHGDGLISSISIPAKGISTSWVHINIPNENKWKNKKLQTTVEVCERGTYPGPSILVTVSTSDHKIGSGEKNAPVILGILVAGILAIGGAVYGFSRWRWPDRPRIKKA